MAVSLQRSDDQLELMLLLEDGTVLVGEDAIAAHLEERFAGPARDQRATGRYSEGTPSSSKEAGPADVGGRSGGGVARTRRGEAFGTPGASNDRSAPACSSSARCR